VYAVTTEKAGRLGLTIGKVETLSDVDRPEDLCVWEDATGIAATSAAQAGISVIIPAVNEADRIEAALEVPLTTAEVETIVVDGGSSDATHAIASARGAKVISCEKGRARQMNAGARAAAGDILVFLHADSRLPRGFERFVRDVLSRPGVSAGAFRCEADRHFAGKRLMEALVNFRSMALGLPYGDQALFVTRAVFEKAGGFPDLPIMEDVEFVRRAKRFGRVAIAPAAVVTSARRWEEHGVLGTTLVNQLVVAGYALGVPPERLRGLYDRNGRAR
jgi:hypothetical protein